jgi:IS30 family transposase
MQAGRPKLEIDSDQVRKLAALHCTVDEIADILNCGRDTIYRHCREELDRGRAEGRMRLRTMQFKSAQSGSASMLIWLGKQILGQRDQQEIINVDEEEKRLSDDEVDDILKKITGNDTNKKKGGTSPTIK